MNRSIGRSGIAWSIVACLVMAGCGGGETDARADGAAAGTGAPAEGGAAQADGDTLGYAPTPDRETLPASRIYFTLTEHEWYARGQPLVHDGAAYRPMGMPVPASVPEMRAAGEYHGVEYYVREADTERAVYVPVFEGYWQPFRADTAAAAAN